jgi:creatinine amidohydrolase
MNDQILSRTVQLERMTSPEVDQACKEAVGIIIIPVGAVEVHGPHLPVGTDTFETYEIGLRAAQQAGVVIAPPLWYGNSRSFMDFPGTISIRPEILMELTRDVCLSLIQHGFHKLVVLDGHGGNYGILDLLIEEIHLETPALI